MSKQLTVVLKTLSKTIIITLALFFTLSLVSLNSFADSTNIPNKGMTQSEVKTNFGEPLNTKDPIGNPPIERWDYANYSVYFEGSYVIHSFFHNQRKQALAPQTMVTDNTAASTETVAVEQVPVESGVAESEVQLEDSSKADTLTQEQVMEDVPASEETAANAEPVEESEKDLNFEEPETKTDYGKWGY